MQTLQEVHSTASWVLHHPFSAEDQAAMAALRAIVEPNKGKLQGVAARVPFDAIMEHVAAPAGVVYEAGRVGGVSGWWCRPEAARPGQAVMHIHGGWFNWGSAQAFRHLTGHIASRAGVAAFVPDYRLAPEHPFPAAAEDVRACYFGLVEQGFSKIAITGDSAGGTLAIGLLVSLAANRAFAAEALVGGVALSPVTDLTLSGESWSTRALADPYFTRPQAAELVRSYLDGEPDLPNERGSSFGWSLPRRQVHRSDSAGAAPADQVEMVTVSRVSRFGSLEAGHLFSNHTSLSWHRWHRGLPADKRLLACVDIVRCH